jgi:hypothetical protein
MANYHYTTVVQALEELRAKGYTVDFNLKENTDKHDAEDFEIEEVYRYEGESDPGDEAVVYGIVSKKGVKGIIVTNFGASVDRFTAKVLQKLQPPHAGD